MTTLDLMRLASGFLWAVIFLLLLGSALRTLVGHRRPSDWAWAWPWAFAIHQVGYAARWWQDWLGLRNGRLAGNVEALGRNRRMMKLIALTCLIVLTYIAVETERDLHRAFRR